MDFKSSARATRWFTEFGGRTAKTSTGILVCVCLLNFGCSSEPADSDSKASQPSARVASSDSDAAGEKNSRHGQQKTCLQDLAEPAKASRAGL